MGCAFCNALALHVCDLSQHGDNQFPSTFGNLT
jgi:hypothetical protein